MFRCGTAIDMMLGSSKAVKHAIEQNNPNLTQQNIISTINNAALSYIQIKNGPSGTQIDIGVDEALQLYEKPLHRAQMNFEQLSHAEIQVRESLSINELNTLILAEAKKLKEIFSSSEQAVVSEDKTLTEQLIKIIDLGLSALSITLKAN